MNPQVRVGIDIGSTTVKIAILNEDGVVLFSDYRRHFAQIQETLAELLEEARTTLGDVSVSAMITGSGGLTWPTIWGSPSPRKSLRSRPRFVFMRRIAM